MFFNCFVIDFMLSFFYTLLLFIHIIIPNLFENNRRNRYQIYRIFLRKLITNVGCNENGFDHLNIRYWVWVSVHDKSQWESYMPLAQ